MDGTAFGTWTPEPAGSWCRAAAEHGGSDGGDALGAGALDRLLGRRGQGHRSGGAVGGHGGHGRERGLDGDVRPGVRLPRREEFQTIAMLDVAAGEGALRTVVTRPRRWMRKSPTRVPSRSSAWARTPFLVRTTSLAPMSGTYRRAAFM
ncbi:hypothetical protein AQJ43_09875 [Streptomyces avermitilis]|uniref:Uncharacterized protein n=1 Tax=Streptomyces avermitilis TaxID=33903 RepID=A0A4D4LRF9_STRAX|nr:hypothetical protein AQJ43_09875 [Streptomyces avermitilis]BBJ48983.1 hypothetical protein SAVMC3_16120 [Streptomyces avermitilis]GDY61028.1 hypothetical protein SAV14893_004210 [Streptomyces avermitilis]GDY78894.1 hypothetical protein SAV31267_083790 [Streptomyces avermitilis]